MDLVAVVRKVIKVSGERGAEAGEAAAIAAFPWLGWPIIRQIFSSILEKYSSALIGVLMNKSTELLMPIIDKMQADAADEASERLKKVIEDAHTTQVELEAEIVKWEEKYEELIQHRRSTPD